MSLAFRIALLFLISLSLGSPRTRAQEVEALSNHGAALYTAEHISDHALERYLDRVPKWNDEIAKLIAKNHQEGSPEAILFLGSSSIRLWETIAQDVAPFKPIRRGFGGSRYCDVAIFAPALVRHLEYRACVIFVANDVTGSNEDNQPTEVARLAQSVIQSVRYQRETIPILLISVTPTPSRFQAWPKIQEVNGELSKLGESIEGVDFLDTSSHYLTADAMPRPELFVDDQLHLNKDGYRIWGQLIRDRLEQSLAK